jgi:hypothetical protein
MTDPQHDTRTKMRQCEAELAAAIAAFGDATRRRWQREGYQDVPERTWQDLGRFGKWRGDESRSR